MDSTRLAWFSLKVRYAARSHSTTARCPKPALAMPKASPPAPLNSSTLFIQKPLNLIFQFVGRANLALPYHSDRPARSSQLCRVLKIAPMIRIQLWNPKVESRLGEPCEGTSRMAVPEASVHKQDLVPLWEYQVR